MYGVVSKFNFFPRRFKLCGGSFLSGGGLLALANLGGPVPGIRAFAPNQVTLGPWAPGLLVPKGPPVPTGYVSLEHM